MFPTPLNWEKNERVFLEKPWMKSNLDNTKKECTSVLVK